MILSVVNWSVKMSAWGYGRETDIEQKRAEAVDGIESGGEGEDGHPASCRGFRDFREARVEIISSLSGGGSCRISPWESREEAWADDPGGGW